MLSNNLFFLIQQENIWKQSVISLFLIKWNIIRYQNWKYFKRTMVYTFLYRYYYKHGSLSFILNLFHNFEIPVTCYDHTFLDL